MNKVNPYPATQTTDGMKSEDEEIDKTSTNDENKIIKLQPLEDQRSQNDDNNSRFDFPRARTLPSIPSTGTDDESCLTITKRNLRGFPVHIWKVLRCKEKLFPKRDNVKPRDLTPKQATKIIVLRLLMILHNILTIWRVTVEKSNQLYWILTLTVALQVLEGVYSLLRDRRIRKR